jgi:hypothetical protein
VWNVHEGQPKGRPGRSHRVTVCDKCVKGPSHRGVTIRVVAGEKGGGGQEVEVRSVERSPMVGGIQQLKRVLPGPASVGIPAPDEVVRRPHSASFRHERRLLQALVVEISPIQGESASTKISPYPVD